MAKQVWGNNIQTRLAAPVAPGDSVISVVSSANVPTLTAGDWFLATIASGYPETKREIVKVTAAAGLDWSVTRAQEGTTAETFSISDKVESRPTAATMVDLQIPKTAVFRLRDDTDTTKQLAFNVASIATGTTRTLTVPDANIVVAGSAAALTSGRVPYVTTGGLLTDSAAITYASNQFYLSDTTTATSTTSGALRVGGGAGFGGNVYVGGVFVSTGNIASVGNITAQGGVVTAGTSSLATIPIFEAVAAAGVSKDFRYSSAGVVRWILRCSADTGSEGGGNLAWNARTDAGASIDEPFVVVRASGGTITLGGTTNRRVVHSSTEAATSTTTGCATFAGGIGVAGTLHASRANLTGAVSTVGVLYANPTPATATSGTLSGIRTEYYANPSGASAAIGIGEYATAETTAGNAQNLTSNLAINAFYGTARHAGTGTVAGANGLYNVTVNSSTGTITEANGVRLFMANTSTGTIGSAAGVRVVSALNSGGGTLTNNYGIYVEAQTAGTNNWAIYTNAGRVRFGGDLETAAGRIEKHTTVTTNTTLDATYHNVLCNSATAITVTLPAAASNSGRVYVITNINAGTVTVDANASETINGALTQALLQWQCVKILSNGTNWFIVSN